MSVPTITLFFHIFNIQRSFAELERVQDLLFPRKGWKMFEVYVKSMRNFKGRYYLVTPIIMVSYKSICDA